MLGASAVAFIFAEQFEWQSRGFDNRIRLKMENIVTINPKVLGGTPCFAGTRVPVKTLFDHLEGGYNVAYFLAQFPSVKREQVTRLLEESRENLEREALAASRG